MMVYKYLQEQYVDPFLSKGEVLFRSLSYFRDYEDCIRGDQYEGTKKFQPVHGLQITKVSTGERLNMPYSFESTVNTDDIFVFCASMVCSTKLAQEFESNACIEINVVEFTSKLKTALMHIQRVTKKEIFHRNVEYYTETKPPIVDWALPEKIIMSKLDCLSHQQEYRFAFCFGDALSTGCTKQRLVKPGSVRPFVASNYCQQKLEIGSIHDICQVHRFT